MTEESLTLTNVTITNNTASEAAQFRPADFHDAIAHVTNTIIADNNGADCLVDFALTSSSHNLDSDGSCGFDGPGDISGGDARLGLLANNGGPTQTHALLLGSDARDAGDDAACPAEDQRGEQRPKGDHCDIGGFEAEPAAGELVIWADNNCSYEPPDPVDSLLTLRFDAGLAANTGECPAFGEEVDVLNASLHLWGDADCSGAIDPVDSLKVLRFDAGLSVAQEEGCPEMGSEVLLG
jgi:hypothetical protein